MNAAEQCGRYLKHESVKLIFGILGKESIDLMDVLLVSEIRFITTPHAKEAAFIADVYSRLTGKAGVCLASMGMGRLVCTR